MCNYTVKLNKKELLILQLSAHGYRDKDISKITKNSTKYVDNIFYKCIFSKLGAVNRPNAVAIAMNNGIIKYDESLQAELK